MPETNFKDKTIFRDMTEWFSPAVLIQMARQAVTTTLFSNYADRRLTQAALDDKNLDAVSDRYDLTQHFKKDADGAFWIDYVADVGDGFDSTYAVAYLLGQPYIDIPGLDHKLPRGGLMIMGGDEVYPAATVADYNKRLFDVYKKAFPRESVADDERPLAFVIPGNHDWYDGLSIFLAKFCAADRFELDGKKYFLGGWKISQQHRSYFSLKLPDNWWIWAFDSQVDDADIDLPQFKYFKTVANKMPENAKIILFASVPSWAKFNESQKGKDSYLKSLTTVAGVVQKEKKARFYAIISGDAHHYSRYGSPNIPTQFITAGGGGSFLHPTHHLPLKIKNIPWLNATTEMSLTTSPDAAHGETNKEACYPPRRTSRCLVLGNWAFPIKNWKFCLIIGTLYWLASLLLGENYLIKDAAASPSSLVVTAALALLFYKYADAPTALVKSLMAVIHTIFHLSAIILLKSFFHELNTGMGVKPGDHWYPMFQFLINAAEMITVGGFVAGIIWGLYLIVFNGMFGYHHNDAFSAMTLTSYRNFLRMRIKDDELTVYSIGVEEVPNRCGWIDAPEGTTGPKILPKVPLEPKLIEDTIVIKYPPK